MAKKEKEEYKVRLGNNKVITLRSKLALEIAQSTMGAVEIKVPEELKRVPPPDFTAPIKLKTPVELIKIPNKLPTIDELLKVADTVVTAVEPRKVTRKKK